ncbi:MAG: 30S ribosomal protein S9 [Candidatus Pacebacteria bacterium]|nr:30S ribosomal protein S9 [Candidatus Paceibacterota bacterium]
MEKKNTYIYAIGRRKNATASVRIYPNGKGSFTVNGKEMKTYFMTPTLQAKLLQPFTNGGVEQLYDITAQTSGGGINGQAESVRHAITRALVKEDEERRVGMKKLGLLKRDPRAKERRKFGLKKARKAPTWSKR